MHVKTKLFENRDLQYCSLIARGCKRFLFVWFLCQQGTTVLVSGLNKVNMHIKDSYQCFSEAQSWGFRGRDPQDFGQGVLVSQEGSWGRSQVVKYYYILSCAGSII